MYIDTKAHSRRLDAKGTAHSELGAYTAQLIHSMPPLEGSLSDGQLAPAAAWPWHRDWRIGTLFRDTRNVCSKEGMFYWVKTRILTRHVRAFACSENLTSRTTLIRLAGATSFSISKILIFF